MKVSFALVTIVIATATDAATIKDYFHKHCKGGYKLFQNIPSNSCALNMHGAIRSIGFSNMPHNAECLGWQAGGNNQACFQVRARKNVGGSKRACLLHPHGDGGPQFAGASWVHGGASKRDDTNATAVEKCTSQAMPNAVVLSDGHMYGLGNMSQAMVDMIFAYAENGTLSTGLPVIFDAYEEAKGGVQERAQEMQEDEEDEEDDDDDFDEGDDEDDKAE